MSKTAQSSIVVFVGLAICAASNGIAQTPKSSGVPETSPAVKSQNSSQAEDRNNRPEEFLVPLGLFDKSIDAERIREREKKADQDHIDDLRAANEANRAAEISAHATLGQEQAAWLQVLIAAVGTAGLLYSLWLTRHALREARIAGIEANKANAISLTALAATHRAWLKTELLLQGEFEIRHGTVGVLIAAVNENIGNAPALRAHTQITMVAAIDDVPEAVKTVCDEGKRPGAGEYGLTVLPGQSYRRAWYASMDLSDISNKPMFPRICPLIVGCVTYETVNDLSQHQTCFVFMIGTNKIASVDMTAPIDLTAESVPNEDLRAVVWAGGHAD